MGSADDSGYLASGDDLDVDTRWFSAAPSHSAEQHLNGALHTFVVVLANSDLARDKDYHEWLGQALKLVQESDGRHRLLVLAETELTVEDFIAVRSRLSSAQFLPCHELGEQAVRPAHLGLIVLNEAGRLVRRHIKARNAAKSQLFISHAKKDGLPLAQARLNQLDQLPNISSFYDARSLNLADNWNRELEHLTALKMMERNSTILHRVPSNASVRHACENLSRDKKHSEHGPVIIYPDPVLPDADVESLTALANYYLPGTRLLTLTQSMASQGAKNK
ncbi:MAG TPA: hypothetical protein EYG03_27290 [Planctomycetes bacterium]|nr:hypothetical protein [Fuerstiella sp.]HIK95669.1 hypothetical protein [Planctomycetota bacterium]